MRDVVIVANLIETLCLLKMKRLAIPLLSLLVCSGAQSIAHTYEGGITAEPISIQNKSTDVLNQSFNYLQGTPSLTPLNVTLGAHEETDWHKHSVPMWAYVTEGSLTVDYGSKGKKVMKKGMSFIEAIDWCHKGINGHKESKLIVVYMGEVGASNHEPCKPQ